MIVNVENLRSGTDQRLQRLEELGYSYALYAPQPGGSTVLVASTPGDMPASPVTAYIPLPGGLNPDLEWQLLVAPERGWVPAWRDPMVGVVVVVSLLIGLLVFAIKVNRRRLVWAVGELKVRV